GRLFRLGGGAQLGQARGLAHRLDRLLLDRAQAQLARDLGGVRGALQARAGASARDGVGGGGVVDGQGVVSWVFRGAGFYTLVAAGPWPVDECRPPFRSGAWVASRFTSSPRCREK